MYGPVLTLIKAHLKNRNCTKVYEAVIVNSTWSISLTRTWSPGSGDVVTRCLSSIGKCTLRHPDFVLKVVFDPNTRSKSASSNSKAEIKCGETLLVNINSYIVLYGEKLAPDCKREVQSRQRTYSQNTMHMSSPCVQRAGLKTLKGDPYPHPFFFLCTFRNAHYMYIL